MKIRVEYSIVQDKRTDEYYEEKSMTMCVAESLCLRAIFLILRGL